MHYRVVLQELEIGVGLKIYNKNQDNKIWSWICTITLTSSSTN